MQNYLGNKTLIALGLPRSGTTMCKQVFRQIFKNVLFTHTIGEEFNDIDLFIVRDVRDAVVSLKQTEKFHFERIEKEEDLDVILNYNFVLDAANNIFPRVKEDSIVLRYEMFTQNKESIYNFIEDNFNVILSDDLKKKITLETSVEANKEIQKQFGDFSKYDFDSGIHGNHLNGGEIGKWRKLIPQKFHKAFCEKLRNRIGDEAYEFFIL